MPNWIHSMVAIRTEDMRDPLGEPNILNGANVDLNLFWKEPEEVNVPYEREVMKEALFEATRADMSDDERGWPLPEGMRRARGTATMLDGAHADNPPLYPLDLKTRGDLRRYGRLLLKNFHDYGATNWWDWRLLRWGTTSNACRTRVTDTGIGMILFEFATAWTHPFRRLFDDQFGSCWYGEWHEESWGPIRTYDDEGTEGLLFGEGRDGDVRPREYLDLTAIGRKVGLELSVSE